MIGSLTDTVAPLSSIITGSSQFLHLLLFTPSGAVILATGAPYVVVLIFLSGYCFCNSQTTEPANEWPTNDVVVWSGYNKSIFHALSAFIHRSVVYTVVVGIFVRSSQ